MKQHGIFNFNYQSRGIVYFVLHNLFGIASCLEAGVVKAQAEMQAGANPKVYVLKNKCALIPKSGN